MNGCNRVKGVGLESGTALVGAEPGTVVGITYYTQVQEVTGRTMAD